MIPPDVKAWLENTQGLISPAEGLRLAELAADVPPNQAIVEIGTHTGLSACWMAAGSRTGNGTHIFCIDPWPEPRPLPEDGSYNDDPWNLGAEGALERFRQNVAGTTQEVPREDYGDLITALRTTSEEAARFWLKPIGLLFIDAIHTYDGVNQDYTLWNRHVAQGGIIAFHDFGDAYPGCRDAIQEVVDSGYWTSLGLTESLWVGQKR